MEPAALPGAAGADTQPAVSKGPTGTWTHDCYDPTPVLLLLKHAYSRVLTTHARQAFSHSAVSVRGRADAKETCTNALNRQRSINYHVCLEGKGAAM